MTLKIESCWLPPKYACQNCTLRVVVSCWSLVGFTGISTGQDLGCLPSLETCVAPSVSMEAIPQGGSIQVLSSSWASGSCVLSACYIQQEELTSNEQTKALIIVCNVLGVSRTTPPNHSKRFSHVWFSGLFRWSLLLEGALSAQMGKFHLNYLCVFIHKLTYLIFFW